MSFLTKVLYQKRAPSQQKKLYFRTLHRKPFWIWGGGSDDGGGIQQHKAEYIRTNRHCCFNHIIGMPRKNGVQMPLFDYQKMIYDALHQEQIKHVWIKKATGLGITELMLRYMAWLCLKDNSLKGSQMCIVTGPRIDLAITLVERIKRLFPSVKFDTKETVVELNGVKIEAFPSHHLDAMRGLPNVSFILLDEADFFPPGQQQDARDVSERYIAKSDPYIVMVSTPNAPEGLFDKIEKEPDVQCLYKRIKLDYRYGLDKIYTRAEIERARKSPSFPREYDLQYLGLIGNVFSTNSLQRAFELGKQYDPDIAITEAEKSLGLDPAYGSSSFAFCLTQLANGETIQVLYADEFKHPDFNEMIDKVVELVLKYKNVRIYVDAANPEIIRSLKYLFSERTDYDKHLTELKHDYPNRPPERVMTVLPVPFSTEHKEMLASCKAFLDDERGLVAINPRFDKLITSLRTAVAAENTLDKERTSYNDILDAFRLSMRYYFYVPPRQTPEP
jgi:hypothetical protein